MLLQQCKAESKFIALRSFNTWSDCHFVQYYLFLFNKVNSNWRHYRLSEPHSVSLVCLCSCFLLSGTHWHRDVIVYFSSLLSECRAEVCRPLFPAQLCSRSTTPQTDFGQKTLKYRVLQQWDTKSKIYAPFQQRTFLNSMKPTRQQLWILYCKGLQLLICFPSNSICFGSCPRHLLEGVIK